jgi:hypothetical protein
MVRVQFWLQLLLMVLIVKQSEAVSEQCSELEEERDLLDHDLTNTLELKHKKEEQAGRCEVSGYCTCMGSHCHTILCSLMLCGRLLY